MRIVFMGTPAFAVPSLATIVASGYDVVAVYTQPPRPSGRGHKLTPSPVHDFADAHGLAVRHPENFKAPEERDAFIALEADVAIVVAYGLILPQAILDAPTHGCLNVHASILPRWRGAAPIQRAIMAQDKMTGVQVMQMEKGLDTGPVLLSEMLSIGEDDTAAALSERLAHLGADLLPRVLGALARGGQTPQPQAEEGVTYAHKISAQEAQVEWTQDAGAIHAHIRGLTPVPGAWTVLERDGKIIRLKIRPGAVSKRTFKDSLAGTILEATSNGIVVATGDGGAYTITALQRPGKAIQDADSFLRGWAITPGECFLSPSPTP
ncbi:MAG: methionyl-tRNA formyltransferase [Pseudomonadota bacterium]